MHAAPRVGECAESREPLAVRPGNELNVAARALRSPASTEAAREPLALPPEVLTQHTCGGLERLPTRARRARRRRGRRRPYEADRADRSNRVFDHGNQIGAVLEHVPRVVAVVAIPANDLLQPVSMDTECAWPTRDALGGERLEPGLLDRLRKARSPAALPFGGPRPSFRVRFEHPQFDLTGGPDSEVAQVP